MLRDAAGSATRAGETWVIAPVIASPDVIAAWAACITPPIPPPPGLEVNG
jgi:hypothetical protein